MWHELSPVLLLLLLLLLLPLRHCAPVNVA